MKTVQRHSIRVLAQPFIFGSLLLGAGLSACSSDDNPEPGGGGSAGAAGAPGHAGRYSAGGEGGMASGVAGRGGAAGDGGAGADTTADGGAAEGGGSGAAGAAGAGEDRADLIARGEYLVLHVAACVDCHTPRTAAGLPDEHALLAGSAQFADLNPADETLGLVPTPNLTPDRETGLGAWTDAEIKNAFQNGIDKDNQPLFSIMPYYVFHNMSAADADAIVAYLRSVPAIKNAIPERQPLGFPVSQAQPVPVNAIPETTLLSTDPKYGNAEHGRYLAGFVGACLDCHSEPDAMSAVPLKLDKLLQGKDTFTRAQLGLPPVFPETIVSSNLTPSVNGLQGWTAEDVATAITQGLDNQHQRLCPPMPSGPGAAFNGMSPADALDIGIYVTSLAARDNGVLPLCVAPAAPGPAASGAGN